MLVFFKKYKPTQIFHLDINHYKSKNCYISRRCLFIKKSQFFRKMFFRTMLLYLNIMNCNFFCSPDRNFFYFVSFIHSTHYIYHPGLYYKNISKLV